MNLSIYLKLFFANIFGKVKIKSTYKHLEYMHENNFITPVYDGYTEIGGFPIPIPSDWYTITSDGKKAMWDKGSLLKTRIISILALIISFLALLINFYKK
ncbi:hypothetical protein ACQCVL_02580 [Bacillus thuringiensis]|uniref:hypothetical protein n=1 Tax=Bacillus thuringiensis TaxID=1428 RepID=UPI000BF2CDCF|nr:hypothetical protein [Bacillus thuringiensis]MED3526662.1 hypothetical protein [Bacillus thuringiensis]MRC31802.1 hypothetical protein [Bacillus thuringiensis]PEZ41345.1 hypothetical protein CN346_00135 [Bacillus thuringiensis]